MNGAPQLARTSALGVAPGVIRQTSPSGADAHPTGTWLMHDGVPQQGHEVGEGPVVAVPDPVDLDCGVGVPTPTT